MTTDEMTAAAERDARKWQIFRSIRTELDELETLLGDDYDEGDIQEILFGE